MEKNELKLLKHKANLGNQILNLMNQELLITDLMIRNTENSHVFHLMMIQKSELNDKIRQLLHQELEVYEELIQLLRQELLDVQE